jgi:NitT/TauT family transport system ATP-binding protein
MRADCNGLSVVFSSEGTETRALDGVTFTTNHGEFVSIVGASGCGKTTLLRSIAQLVKPSSGGIELIPHPGDTNSDTLLVFQESGLFPWMRVLENATFGLAMRGVERAERELEALRLLRQFGLGGRERAWPSELSLGMRQRVALIRAFLCKPALLLMDEPFAALDAQTRLKLQQELLALWQPTSMSVIFVTHDVDEAILLSDRVLVMSPSGGRIQLQLDVPLSQPRDAGDLTSEEFVAIKREVLKRLAPAKEQAMHA